MSSCGAPLTLPTLPSDVLAEIVSYLSPRQAIALSYTCKAVHSIPIARALHTVVLDRDTKQIKEFRDFLLATESRPNCLKSLVLAKAVTSRENGEDASEPAAALADILEKAARLRHFKCGYMEIFNCASEGRVATAFVDLKELREVSVEGGGRETMNAIMSLNSLGIRVLDMSGGDINMPYDDFFKHLQSYQSGRRQREPLAVLATNFMTPRVAPSWPHTLRRAHLDIADLDIWPLSCRVKWLDLGLFRTSHSREALMLVGQTKPRVLSLAYRVNPDNLFWANLPPVATELRFLEARVIELSGHPKENVLMHLQGLDALTAIFLCVRAFYQPVDLDDEFTSIVLDLARKNRQLRFVGMSFIDGRFLRDDGPMWGEERFGSRWWMIQRTNLEGGTLENMEHGSALPVPISTEVGLKVRDYMYEADYESPDWPSMGSLP